MSAADEDDRNPFGRHEPTRKITLRRRESDRKVVFPTLRVVAGKDMMRFVTLHDEDEVLIGRDENGALVLTDGSVSRRHARVTCNDDGAILVEDLGSTNGTAVNGTPIDRATLRPGDHLEVGTVSLRLDLLGTDEIAHLANVLARLEAKNRDPLTGLLTRTWLREDLPDVLEAADQRRTVSACLFIDVDHFKSVNDRFGHQTGDGVLQNVAKLLVYGVRETDACVRYGGEELLVFLLDTTEDASMEVAERLRRAIEEHDWTRTDPALTVTASIGVAVRQPAESPARWIDRADRALYAAKGRGRNQVVRAADVPSPSGP